MTRIWRAGSSSEKWPCPTYHIDEEPQFLFIITPPYSGSTALAQVLNSSHGTAFLQKRGEGQWLVPGMCETDRWTPEKQINWKSVRAVWLRQIEFTRQLVQNVELVIEKSPPNLVRIDQLTQTFPNHSLVAFNRNPYASCSSLLSHQSNLEDKTEAQRIQALSTVARKWLSRSKWIRKWIEERQIAHFSYEKFCDEPSLCVSELAVRLPIFRTADVNKDIKVKKYKMQGIRNYNAKQIELLSQREIGTITEVLKTDLPLVSFFGYDTSENW